MQPFIVAHRGASGYRPENTIAAFDLAVELGARAIETDLVLTKDGDFILRHDNWLHLTTNAADLPHFSDRLTTKTVGNHQITSWFSEDFSSAEFSHLQANTRLDYRQGSKNFDGQPITTLGELLTWHKAQHANGIELKIFLEVKHPAYFESLGFNVGQLLLAKLDAHQLHHNNSGLIIESFDADFIARLTTNLPKAVALESVPLALTMPGGRPGEQTQQAVSNPAADDKILTTQLEYLKNTGVQYVCPSKKLISSNQDLLAIFNQLDLQTVAWTFAADDKALQNIGDQNITPDLDNNRPDEMPKVSNTTDANEISPTQLAAYQQELTHYANLGLTGFFCDHPDLAIKHFAG